MSTFNEVMEVLKSVSETDEVQKNPDLELYGLEILDSMKTVQLMAAFSEKFGIEISPAEFERERWATPRMIAADIESKIGA